MRTFVIVDSSKRKAKPVGVLTWEPDQDDGQGRFSLQVASGWTEERLPLSLSFCARRERGRATPEESEDWARSRIVPESRHNIAEVLAANGLAKYSVIDLLTACKARSSDDDLLAYEVDVPQEFMGEQPNSDRASGRSAEGPSASKADESSGGLPREADRIIASVRRKRTGAEVHYAFVSLNDANSASKATSGASGHPEIADSPTAAQVAAKLIRDRRRKQGLTQKQLAARAGITQTVLSRVESGRGNPTLELLEDLAAALGTQLHVSFDDKGSQL